MSTLTALYEQDVERVQASKAALVRSTEEKMEKQAQIARGWLYAYLENWKPMQEMLGLKREPAVDGERLLVQWEGTSAINNVPIQTRVRVAFPGYDHIATGHRAALQIVLVSAEDERVFVQGEIQSQREATEYPQILGRLCSLFMERHAGQLATDAQAAAHREAQLAEAKGLIETARTYAKRYQDWERKCAEWAAYWAAQLWEPHELWRVTYRPVGPLLETDDELLETLVVMETPEDIINALEQFPTATVTAAGLAGDVKEMEIPSFVNAERIVFDTHIDDEMAYHRRYWAETGHVVNVPPYSNMRPDTNAPSIVGWTAYLIECRGRDAFHRLDPEVLAKMTPEQVVQEYKGWLTA